MLLKLSWSLESRKFDKTVKIITVAPHPMIISNYRIGRLSILSIGCGLLFYPQSRQCESQRDRVRQYVPTPSFYFKSWPWGQGGIKGIMKKTFAKVFHGLLVVSLMISTMSCEPEIDHGTEKEEIQDNPSKNTTDIAVTGSIEKCGFSCRNPCFFGG